MAQGFAIPLPLRLFDGNGLPAVGWKIFYTHAGAGTSLTTYSNAILTSANSDPVITDAAGYFNAFVANAVIADIAVQNAAGVSQFTLLSVEAMGTQGATGTAGPQGSTGATGSTGAAGAAGTGAPPPGAVIWSPYSTLPTGWLVCNGAAVSRTTYAALAALAATDSYPNGAGDGSTTFNLPDLRGRAPYGLAVSGTGNTLGGTFGAIDHTHTGPSHTHSVVVTRDGWGEALNIPSTEGRLNVGAAAGTGQFNSSYQPTADLTVTSAAGGTGITGVSNPPGLAGYWFVKT